MAIVEPLLEGQVRIFVELWMKENSEKVTAIIDEAMKKGVCGLVAEQINSMMNTAFFQFGEQMKQQLLTR